MAKKNTDRDIINKIKDFLSRSSEYYSTFIKRKKRDLEIYSGNFWSDDVIKDTDRTGRLCKSFTMYPKYCNAIISPFNKSPYHADIEDKDGIYAEIQEQLDRIENGFDVKFIIQQALKHACVQGTGFFILSTSDNKIVPEVVRDVAQVAMDPGCQDLSGADAEEGAIVNIIPLRKAKRIYGDDITVRDDRYLLSNFGDQWTWGRDMIPVVSYYKMNEKGTVSYYKVCGDKVIINGIEIPTTRIPIFRICFNEIVRNNKIDYNGIVDMTADLQFGMNLGYSTLLERANRTPKANFMMPAKALDGLDEFYKRLHTKESLVCLYNGDVAPTPIVEQYQTQDLMGTIQACNDLMSNTIGVPSQGINPATRDQTATEILVQQNNSESNLDTLYSNAHDAIYQMNKTIIEILCWQNNIEEMPEFKLINGPQVITKMMKRRQELLAISNLVDEKTKKIIAKAYVETLDDEVKTPLLADIIANTEDVTFLSDSTEKEDPRAYATLQKMNNVLMATQDELERQVAINAEMKKELDQLNLQLINAKEQHILELRKQDQDFAIAQAKLNLDAEKVAVDVETKAADADVKLQTEGIKLEKELMSLENKKMDIASKAIDRVTAAGNIGDNEQ